MWIYILPQSVFIAPREFFFFNGCRELPFAGSGVIQPGGVIGKSPAPLIQVLPDSVDWKLTERLGQTNAHPSVDAVGSVEAAEPIYQLSALLDRLDDAQRKSSLAWNRIPTYLSHLRDVRFDSFGLGRFRMESSRHPTARLRTTCITVACNTSNTWGKIVDLENSPTNYSLD